MRSFDRSLLVASFALFCASLAGIVTLALDAKAAKLLFDQRAVFAIATAIILFFAVRVPAANAARALRYGWLAALPIPARSTRSTLLLATTVFGAMVLACLAIGLAGLGVGLGRSAYFAVLLPSCVGVTIACLGLGGIALRAWHRPMAMPATRGVRVPLLSLAWLEHRELPYLVAWQNRECAQQWRMGGGAKPIGAVLLLFPGAPSQWQLFGLIVMALVVAWHRCMMQSSLWVAERAAALGHQWTLPKAFVRNALLRLPLAGSVAAAAVLFALLQAVQPPLLAVASVALILVLASPITFVRLAACLRKNAF
ncbi:hypothetical protein [Cognatiluteimonas telluris]|uniref:hypothetical protein n=1 Tax=Cognatiluteimonas telluris TaxID=1104775 RepID=UPI00140AA946|nr:hypothetical protein [Lysobacter telluris]